MNFEHMPELGWTCGYPIALLLMATSRGGLWVLVQALRLALIRR